MIPLIKACFDEMELSNVCEAIRAGALSGNGRYTGLCQDLLRTQLKIGHVQLTHSATAGLEICALLLNLQPGDEVIMPSFTFVSTANAFVLRGAVPVFVDIRKDTLNIDETLIEGAITKRTKAIIPVHYAGVGCEMDEIMKIASRHDLKVVEDAAQGVMAYYKGRPLGAIGDMGVLSFHATKNVSCGEGGAFLTNSAKLGELAEIIREKGTNRSQFLRGEIDKYSWMSIGSSYIPSEMNAAYLFAQLQKAQDITQRRMNIWDRYHEAFRSLEIDGRLRRPVIPVECTHNAHIYYLLLPDAVSRNRFIERLKARGIGATFHYIPLHSAPNASSCSRSGSQMNQTDDLAGRLVRLPLWPDMQEEVGKVIDEVIAAVAVAG